MFKQINSLVFLVALFVLGLSYSCQTAASEEVDTEENITETTDDKPKTVMPETKGVPMKGDHYEIVILNDSIKSPRKELRGSIAGVDITVNYGSPAANGRELYGALVPYGQVWRTGANEAVRITTSAPLKFGKEGKDIPAGTYGLFTLPTDRDNWTIIFNKDADQWGAYDYSESDDVARVSATSITSDDFNERMDFSISGDALNLHWGDLTVPVKVMASK